jgi:hypothetical protein
MYQNNLTSSADFLKASGSQSHKSTSASKVFDTTPYASILDDDKVSRVHGSWVDWIQKEFFYLNGLYLQRLVFDQKPCIPGLHLILNEVTFNFSSE